jgi:hypothetical protein
MEYLKPSLFYIAQVVPSKRESMAYPGKPVRNQPYSLRLPGLRLNGTTLEAGDNAGRSKGRDNEDSQGCPSPVREAIPERLDEAVWRVRIHVGQRKGKYQRINLRNIKSSTKERSN